MSVFDKKALDEMTEKILNTKISFEPLVIIFTLRQWKQLEASKLTGPLEEPDEHGYLGLGSVAGSYTGKRYIDFKIPTEINLEYLPYKHKLMTPESNNQRLKDIAKCLGKELS